MGYMGSGKSTIGSELSKILDYKFVDLDTFIETRETQSVSEIFKNKGEIYFRRKETDYLKELLDTNDKMILALGGGTPCYGINMDLISSKKSVLSIYLKASLNELYKRLLPKKAERPLISHLEDENDFMEFLGKHLFERSSFYSKAQTTIITDNKSINETVQEVVLSLI